MKIFYQKKLELDKFFFNMNEDFEWFEQHYKELQYKYGNAFLAIKNKQVIGIYDSYGNGVRETQKTEELGTFIIQECNKDCIDHTCYIASMNFHLMDEINDTKLLAVATERMGKAYSASFIPADVLYKEMGIKKEDLEAIGSVEIECGSMHKLYNIA